MTLKEQLDAIPRCPCERCNPNYVAEGLAQLEDYANGEAQ